MHRTIKDMVRDWKHRKPYGEHTAFAYNFGSACTSYGLCDMTTLCTSASPEAYYHEYEHRLWNPLTKSTLEEE